MKKLFAVVGLLLFLDLFTKWFFSLNDFMLIPGFFSFTYVLNTGAAFSILQGMRFLFVAVAVAVILWSFIEYRKERHFGFALIIAGSLGNMLDRLLLGYVRDFISIWIWPVFNLADIFNVLGVAFIIYRSWKKKDPL